MIRPASFVGDDWDFACCRTWRKGEELGELEFDQDISLEAKVR